MSPKEWFSQGSPKVVGAALATALVAGLGAGVWLELPAYLAVPVYTGSPQMILADDPGREKWDQVVASLGGLGATFVVPAAFDSDHSEAPEFTPDLSAQITAATAEIDAQLKAAEQRAQAIRLAWVEPTPQRYGYEPVIYSAPAADAPPVYGRGYEPVSAREAVPAPEPEQTTAEADDPQPPPPPRPSTDWAP